MESILPSEIARLVYGYLEEEGCKSAAKTFLETSSHLRECVSIASKGRKFTTKFQGLDLVDLLDLICELCCYVRSVECEMKTRQVSVAEVLHQFAKILRLVNESTPNKPLYLRFTVPSPKKGRKTKPSKSSSSLVKSPSPETSPTAAKCSSSAVDENPESPEDADPNEILFQCLLGNKALHEKLAENINQVVATKCDSEPLEKILEKKIVETIINTTEQDPIFQEMIEELVGPVESTTNSYDPKISEDQTPVTPQPAATPCNSTISAEDVCQPYYNQKLPTASEAPRPPSCRHNFPGFSPPTKLLATSALSKPLTVMTATGPHLATTIAPPAVAVSQSPPQNQQPLMQKPFLGSVVTAYAGTVGDTPVPVITDGAPGLWQTYTYPSNATTNQLGPSAISPGLGSTPLRPIAPAPENLSLVDSCRPLLPKLSVSTIKVYTPAIPCQPKGGSSLENLLKQPFQGSSPTVQRAKPKLPSKLPSAQPVMTRSTSMPLRTGGVRTRGGIPSRVYGGAKRAKVLYSVTSSSQNQEKVESPAPAVCNEATEPMYKIVVRPVSKVKKPDGDREVAPSTAKSTTAALHASETSATERNSIPSIVVSQAESSCEVVTASSLPAVCNTGTVPTPIDSSSSTTPSTANPSVAVVPPSVECAAAPTTSCSAVESLSNPVSSTAASRAETTTTSSLADHVTAASSTEVITSLVNATPQHGSGVKKNLRKRVSLSTPRKGSHVRTLEFATPPKSAKGVKKSFSSPKHKTPQSMPVPNKALENVKSVLFKSPPKSLREPKKKKAWDADLRVVFSADDDIPTSVGLKRKPAAVATASNPSHQDDKAVENDEPDDVHQTSEEIVSRIQKDVLDVIGEENIGDLSGISFETNRSPDILHQTTTDVKTPCKSPGTSSVQDIGDIGIPSSTIKRLYPRHEVIRDENSTSDLPAGLKPTSSPHKRLLDSVTSKLFGTPPRTSSPCASLPATPSSVSLEAALIRECARIESESVTERPFKDIALTCPQPSAGESEFEQSSSLLPPPKGTHVFKTPAKSTDLPPVEMTPVSKIIHEVTKVNQCILLTPTIPPTPDTDQMKNAVTPHKPEEETTPPDPLKRNGPVEPNDQTDSQPSRPAKTPSKTPQIRLRSKSKPRDPPAGRLPARKKEKTANEEREDFSKLIEECFQRATGAVFGPSEVKVIPPSPEPQPKKRNRRPSNKKVSLMKASGSRLASKPPADEMTAVCDKTQEKLEIANSSCENEEPDQPSLKDSQPRRTRRKPRKSADTVVLPSVEPAEVSVVAVSRGRQKQKTRKKPPAGTNDEVQVTSNEPEPSEFVELTPTAEVFEADLDKIVAKKSLSTSASSGGTVEQPSTAEDQQSSEVVELSSIRSPSPVNAPDSCTARIDMDNYASGYQNHDGRSVYLRISPFLDFFELPRDSLAGRSSKTQRRLPKLSSQSSHQVVSIQREEHPKRKRRSASFSSSGTSEGRGTPMKRKPKKQRTDRPELNRSHKRYNREFENSRPMIFEGRSLRDSIKPTYKYGQRLPFLKDRRYGRYSPGRYVPPNRRNKHVRKFSHKDRPSRRSRERSTHRSRDRSRSRGRDRSDDRSKNRSASHGSQSTSSSKKSSAAKSSKDQKPNNVEIPAERSCDALRDLSFSGVVTAAKSSSGASMIAPPPLCRPPRSRADDELEEGELSDTSRSTVFSSCKKPEVTTKIFPARLSSPVDDESRQALLEQVDLDKFLSIVHSQDKK